ncbi:MAG: DUF2269 domain-containing protein [Brevundimonas sp.]|nr:DUF2269 domain-containing protein [Brevundimonas sp.]
MSLYVLLKLVHVLSAAVLFGTGAGIAFFMVRARSTRDPAVAAAVGRMVVQADFLFTATAVVVQPLSGLALMRLQGYSPGEPWLLASYGLYVLVGACWLPVVWIQQRLVRLAAAAAAAGEPLPPAYDRLYRIWFALGWPAFAGVIGIYVLMLSRPAF